MPYVPPSPVLTATDDYPELVVEWMPTQGPGAADGDWCDITRYVAAGDAATGRNYELDRFQAGTCNLTLRAETRLFDREWTSGPFYPWLVPMRQVRVSAVWPSPDGLVLDGTGDYASTPDKAAWTVTGVMEVAVRVNLADYTKSGDIQMFMAHWPQVTTNRAWLYGVNSSGQTQFVLTADGSTHAVNVTAAGGLTDGTSYWLGLSYNTATGAWAFYRHADQEAEPARWGGWTTLGSGTATAAVPFNSTGELMIGATQAGTRDFAAGTIYAVSLYDDGVRVASPNFSPAGSPLATPGAATYTDAQGNVWTLAGDAEIGGVDVRYPIWRGYITDIGETVPDDVLFVTEITAKDAFVVLEQAKLSRSPYVLAVLDSGPAAYYRLGENSGVEMYDSSPNEAHGTYTSTPTAATSLVAEDDQKAGVFAPDLRGRAHTTFVDNAASLECLFSTTDTDGTLLAFQGGGSFTSSCIVYVAAGNLVVWSSTSLGVRRTSTTTVNDGKTHHLVVAPTNLDGVWLDGVNITASMTTVTPADPPSLYAEAVRGDLVVGNNFVGTDGFSGTLDEVALYYRTLTDAEIGAHYAAATEPWDGDTTGERIERVLDAIGWSDTLRDIDAGISTMQAFSGTGSTALDAVHQAADTEMGHTYVDGSGRVVHRSRHAFLLDERTAVSQATFGDAHSSATLHYALDSFELPSDENLIRNPVTTSRSGGASHTAADRVLIDEKYGNRDWSAPVSYDDNDNVLADRAALFLARYKEVATRLASMRLDPRRDPANLWPQLDREIGDRITVTRTPLGLGNQIDTEQLVEWRKHVFSPTAWVAYFRGSPAETGHYWILGDSIDGRLGSTTRLAY